MSPLSSPARLALSPGWELSAGWQFGEVQCGGALPLHPSRRTGATWGRGEGAQTITCLCENHLHDRKCAHKMPLFFFILFFTRGVTGRGHETLCRFLNKLALKPATGSADATLLCRRNEMQSRTWKLKPLRAGIR